MLTPRMPFRCPRKKQAGGCLLSMSNLTVTSTTFELCTAVQSGGALSSVNQAAAAPYASAASLASLSRIVVMDSNVSNCSAVGPASRGGA